MPGRVAVALSGGVDSSVAAALLLEAGWEVVGVHLRLVPCDEDGAGACCGPGGVEAARAAAASLGMPFYDIDATALFRESILRPAWESYAAGRTPNPCVHCNRLLKLDLIGTRAAALGATHIATGHYARVVPGEDGAPRLLTGLDEDKDQSYFLFALGEGHLRRLLLPLGGLTKAEVRRVARDRGLANAERAESQDACLVARAGGLGEALRVHLGEAGEPGRLVDEDGAVLGEHGGVHRFTMGQRRGLGVALGRPAFVREVRAESREVVLTTDPASLLTREIHAEGATWLGRAPEGVVRCQVRSRYRSPRVPAEVLVIGDRIVARLEREVRAATPGQALVLYDGERVLGGGWIA